MDTRGNEETLIKIILDEPFNIHKSIGPGMLENVYKTCLAYRLRQKGIYVEVEKPCARDIRNYKNGMRI